MLACLSKLGMMPEQWGWSGDNGKNVGTRVNVISFTRTRKHGLPSANFHKTHKCSTTLFSDPSYQISSKRYNGCGMYMCHKKVTSLSRVWLSQHWFSWNLLLLSIFCDCILFRILSKLYKKCRKYGQHSIHALTQSILSLSWSVRSTCLPDKFY